LDSRFWVSSGAGFWPGKIRFRKGG
jgi:hypothetical protein